MEDANSIIRLAQTCERCAYVHIDYTPTEGDATSKSTATCRLHEYEFRTEAEPRSCVCGFFC
jgi:hypothetical protein